LIIIAQQKTARNTFFMPELSCVSCRNWGYTGFSEIFMLHFTIPSYKMRLFTKNNLETFHEKEITL
jgi:hypothetical protein